MPTPTKKSRSPFRIKARRLMTAELEDFVSMDRLAKAAGVPWSAWALQVLLARVRHRQGQEKAGQG
jgi:hypothetical protein